MKRVLAVVVSLVLCAACSSRYAYMNKPLPDNNLGFHSHASFDIQDDRGNPDVLLMLALSGGGSRAAYFSAEVMLRLQQAFGDIDILKEVDVISSVSGGSLPAAYYAVSSDPEGFTANVSCPLECGAFGSSGSIFCDARKRQVGFRKKAGLDDRSALLAACPEERMKIERLFERSREGVRSNRVWDRETVEDLMTRNYIRKWTGNWFWPANVFRYWFTAYDRSDIMAQTLEDNMFDVKPDGTELTFADLNPERPYLVLNATNGTGMVNTLDRFGDVFTFTQEDFSAYLRSDIDRYSVARAVTASAAFPALFNYMTLADFYSDRENPTRFLHVFDGGNSDNLGLKSLQALIGKTAGRYTQYIVILVDAFVQPHGEDCDISDPRRGLSYFVDSNFMDSFDSLLNANRNALIDDVIESGNSRLTFWHLTFGKVGEEVSDIDPEKGKKRRNLKQALNRIPTHFKITGDDQQRIGRAVQALFEKDQACLNRIRDILLGKEPGEDTCDSHWAKPGGNK